MTTALRWTIPVLRMLHECPLKSTGLYSAANSYLKDGSFTLSLIPLLAALKSGMTVRGRKVHFYLFLKISNIFTFHTSNLFHKCVGVATSKPFQFWCIFPWCHVKSVHTACPVKCDSEQVPDEGALG